MKIVIESKSEVSQNTPQNENCHRVQIQGVPEYLPKMIIVIESKSKVFPPKMKIVIESKSKVSQNTPPHMKIVIECKSKCPRILPPNENCQRV